MTDSKTLIEPIIILVHPQIGENIGATARAMLNCGLTRMRLVRPREFWPNEKAQATAAGADVVLEGAEVFTNLEDAVADIHHLYATTARPRDMVKPTYEPRKAVSEIQTALNGGAEVGILFGAERSGLDNDAVTRSDAIIEVPTNPDFSSLNLAQAVLILGYEWRMAQMFASDDMADGALHRGGAQTLPATKKDLDGLLDHLIGELDEAGFLRPPEKKPTMALNIRNIFTRSSLTDQEVRTLRGVITSLVKFR